MPIVFAIKTNPPPEPVQGLYKLNESDPINSTLTLTLPTLIDGVTDVFAIAQNWSRQYSYAVDLGAAGEISGLDIYCRCTYGTPTDWYQPGNDWGTVGVYKSDDNVTWSLVQQYEEPPSFSSGLQQWNFRLTLPSNQTARYFKVRNNQPVGKTGLAVEGGALLQIAEIELILP